MGKPRPDAGGSGGAGLGGPEAERRRNVEAIAFLALLLSFGTLSLFNLTTRPVVCFPGDIGTLKCPVTGPLHAFGTSSGTNSVASFNNLYYCTDQKLTLTSVSGNGIVATGQAVAYVNNTGQFLGVILAQGTPPASNANCDITGFTIWASPSMYFPLTFKYFTQTFSTMISLPKGSTQTYFIAFQYISGAFSGVSLNILAGSGQTGFELNEM